MGIYKIADWHNRYETHESRKLKKLAWVPVPNSHDGLAYRLIVSHRKGAEIFGAWCLILQIASKMPERGILVNETGPLDAADLSMMTGFPVTLFELALEYLSSRKIGWIQQSAGTPGESAGTPGFAPGNLPEEPRDLRDTVQGMEGNGKKGRDSEARSRFTPPSIESVTAYCTERGNCVDPQKFVDHYEANGWRVGRNPMKDWQAAVRTWEKSEFNKGSGNGTGKRTRTDILDNDARDLAAALRGDNGFEEAHGSSVHPAHGPFSTSTRTGT